MINGNNQETILYDSSDLRAVDIIALWWYSSFQADQKKSTSRWSCPIWPQSYLLLLRTLILNLF